MPSCYFYIFNVWREKRTKRTTKVTKNGASERGGAQECILYICYEIHWINKYGIKATKECTLCALKRQHRANEEKKLQSTIQIMRIKYVLCHWMDAENDFSGNNVQTRAMHRKRDRERMCTTQEKRWKHTRNSKFDTDFSRIFIPEQWLYLFWENAVNVTRLYRSISSWIHGIPPKKIKYITSCKQNTQQKALSMDLLRYVKKFLSLDRGKSVTFTSTPKINGLMNSQCKTVLNHFAEVKHSMQAFLSSHFCLLPNPIRWKLSLCWSNDDAFSIDL